MRALFSKGDSSDLGKPRGKFEFTHTEFSVISCVVYYVCSTLLCFSIGKGEFFKVLSPGLLQDEKG